MVTSVLRSGREAFRRRMRATCVIKKPTMVRNPVTKKDEISWVQVYPAPGWPTEHPDKLGPCYTRYPGLAHEQSPKSAGSSVVQTKLVARIPHGVSIAPGMRVEITSDPDNPQMVGQKFLVASIDDMSQSTAQRLLCDDIQYGAER